MCPVLLSIGHGYAAAAVVRALSADWRVMATTRRPERAAELASEGLEPVIWQPGGPAGALAAALEEVTHIVVSVPPEAGADPVVTALAGLPSPRLRWIGYLSAASVHGDTGGDWIDETTPAMPTSPRGQARRAAELAWETFGAGRGAGVALFRIAGIYGPGRSAIEALRAGRAHRIVKPGQVFNRIHVEDLGRIVAAAAIAGATGPFIVSDAHPAPPQDVVTHAAGLIAIAPPPEEPFESATLSPMARSFYAENKRLRSVRVGPELGVPLLYPDYRAGLAAILAETG